MYVSGNLNLKKRKKEEKKTRKEFPIVSASGRKYNQTEV